MNMRVLIALTGLVEVVRIALISLAQTDVIPDGILEIAKDFPVLAIFLGILFYLSKWGERILEAQRVALKEVYDAHQDFVAKLFEQNERKQSEMDEDLKRFVDELALMRATISEVVKVDDVLDRLMEKIESR